MNLSHCKQACILTYFYTAPEVCLIFLVVSWFLIKNKTGLNPLLFSLNKNVIPVSVVLIACNEFAEEHPIVVQE